ncbi:carboxylesterase [Colletotrichum asianum]
MLQDPVQCYYLVGEAKVAIRHVVVQRKEPERAKSVVDGDNYNITPRSNIAPVE